ncbi:IS4 family transposase, partial [Sphingobacterium litopenaei]
AELNRLKRKVYLMDATIIPLCLSVFDWAKFRSAKGAVKLHTILDYDGCMPSFVHITDGKQHESKIAKTISFPKGCVVVVDRGYVDYAWMNVLDSNQSFFVTRSKSNMKYTVVKTFQSEALKDNGVLQDQIIELDGDAKKHYQGKKMRIVRFWDSINKAEYEFLTNNFTWKASTVAALYK